jgi:Ni/Fe-hydrogenase subunit HybB-like protein
MPRNTHRATNHHYRPHVITVPPAQVVADGQRLMRPGGAYGLAVALFGLLFLLGVVGFILRLSGGFEHRERWAYFGATIAFILSTFQSAPVVAVAGRLAKGHWRRPVTRTLEMCSLAGIISLLMVIPAALVLPPTFGRPSLYFDSPLGIPLVWNVVIFGALFLAGLGLVFLSARPDRAMVRALEGDFRAARAWPGATKQWRVLEKGMTLLSAFYLMAYVGAHTVFATDFAMSQIPGWHSAIFPALHAIDGLQAACATAILVMALVRRFGRLEAYISVDPFWGVAKLMLALTLLWMYFHFAEFLTLWYGRTPREIAVLTILYGGPYLGLFLVEFLFVWLIPFIMLLVFPVRRSIRWNVLVALSILFGLFLDRIRLYSAAFSVENVFEHMLEHIPGPYLPDAADIMILVGGISGAVLVYLLAVRLVPLLALWEVRQALLFSRAIRYLRTEATVVAKPE